MLGSADMVVQAKRPPNAGKGRKRGVPNQTTRTVREIFTLFVEYNAEGAQALYDRIAKKIQWRHFRCSQKWPNSFCLG
jgi:hypothetical protein